MTSSLRDLIDRQRESLEKLVDEGSAPIQVPIVHPPRPGEEWASVETKLLVKRKYVQLAPWAIREYRYVANVFVDPEDPDVPLVFGEWRVWYRYDDFMDPQIPPHVDDVRTRWAR